MKIKLGPTKKRSLVTLISQIVILVICILTLGVLVQSFQFSNRIIKQEVNRTLQQTSSLIQSLFDYRLAVLQIHQDSNAKSDTLVDFFVAGDEELLDYYFLGLDQREPKHVPDVRFIAKPKGIIWDDGNAEFYGLSLELLNDVAEQVAFNSNWHILELHSSIGLKHLLVRRSPIINDNSGEVLGQLYVGMILDNNVMLIESLQRRSNSDNVVLALEDLPIATTLLGSEPYTADDIISFRKQVDSELGETLVSATALKVNDEETPLTVFTVEYSKGVMALKRNHQYGLIFTMLAICAVFAFTRKWVQKKVSNELAKLMTYTKLAGIKDAKRGFEGSTIYEFDHIGHTLESTFERLAEQEKSFQDLFNFALSPTIVWSGAGDVLQMNPAARKELSKANELGQYKILPHFDVFKSQLIPHIRMSAQGATLTGVNVPIGDKVYRWNLSPIRIEGDISSIIVQGQDVTTFIEAEKQSDLARKEAEESAKMRADFLAKMSHEIRTPLNGILGVSQLLKRSIHDAENLKQIDVLCNSGEHLLAVLNDILDFSKLEQGKFNIQLNEFKFSELVNTLETIYQPACAENDVQLVINNNLATNTLIYTDQVRLNQILFNLLSNAVKFTHSGTIKIGFDLEQFESANNDMLIINIKDSGIGIDPKRLDAMFDPFVQEESTTTREYGGSGLGLTIVKNLVDMLGGDIQVGSEKGVGTEFVVTVPVKSGSVGSDFQSTEQELLPHELFDRTLKVLLVEDNGTNAFIAQAFCKKYGMDVQWTKDGLSALKIIEAESFDLILMDNQLPNLGGIETTMAIRNDLHISTPIYACTADSLASTNDAFIAAGANYVIVKPIKEHVLHAAFVHFKRHFLNSEE
ncbi:response regulator [Vibrio sp. 03-59-1]|uniref:quorum-sensing autoinducer 2 sensor kinase/phosphatase LuxQ n=1 Tax=Vibrio sp. 03-59-1 TaxID=2607607 RepID=UPI001493697A|nr:quorum-sensing autoinducer 2 sensor kinase/phosphatase LuxQ [Vibrio sp. 03-59-1]NOH82795.1 response regulator [Vibrio sp. 03-59-1]